MHKLQAAVFSLCFWMRTRLNRDADNNEELAMTNSVCRIALHQLRLDTAARFFLNVCVLFLYAHTIYPHKQHKLY